MHLTAHVLDSYREFYPTAEEADLLTALQKGVSVAVPIALKMVGRTGLRSDHRGAYILHEERTGIFVLDDEELVTFLRFYSLQQYRLACRLYPGGTTPTAQARWNVKPPIRFDFPLGGLSGRERTLHVSALNCFLRDVKVPGSLVTQLYGERKDETEVTRCRWEIRLRLYDILREKASRLYDREVFLFPFCPSGEEGVELAIYKPWGLPDWWVRVGRPPPLDVEHMRMADILVAAGWHVKPPTTPVE